MKILNYDEREGKLKLLPESVEDLWHMEKVIQPGDFVSSRSMRRFKTKEGESKEKRPVFIQVRVEKVKFHKHAQRLRLMGRIVSGSPEELVRIGSYHTIEAEPGRVVEIKKESGWRKHQLLRLKKAERSSKRPRLGIVLMDERKALFAYVMAYGIDFSFEIENKASKKGADYEESQRNYFGEVTRAIKEMKVDKILIAGPGFAKDNLRNFLKEREGELISRVRFDSCSTAERSGAYELMKRGIFSKLVGEARVEEETALMDKLMEEIARNGMAAYGLDEVNKALEYGAVSHLLVADELLRKDEEVERLLDTAESIGAEVSILSSENEAGERLMGIGGIAALLRFRI